MTSKRFTKVKEDFTCSNCSHLVTGNGYTNHCPACLWSLHVDVNPGDRAADCSSLMEPVGVLKKNQEYIIVHRCLKCGHEKPNKSSPEDDFDQLVKLVKNKALR